VVGGKLIAGRISERKITAIGGALFFLFAGVAAVEL
jgi:putative Ca2+/H+ antiporter (TMEM165/GDT1 family)